MAKRGLAAFFVGGAIGAGVALLFAPRSGTQTRAMLTDKAGELWGEGQEIYEQGYEKFKTEAAHVQTTAVQANDELRAKIENARTAIAEQVAKNAQSARDAINSQMPVAGEKINQAVDVVKGQIDNAAEKLKTATASTAEKDADAVKEVASENAPTTSDKGPGAVADVAGKAAQAVSDAAATAEKIAGEKESVDTTSAGAPSTAKKPDDAKEK